MNEYWHDTTARNARNLHSLFLTFQLSTVIGRISTILPNVNMSAFWAWWVILTHSSLDPLLTFNHILLISHFHWHFPSLPITLIVSNILSPLLYFLILFLIISFTELLNHVFIQQHQKWIYFPGREKTPLLYHSLYFITCGRDNERFLLTFILNFTLIRSLTFTQAWSTLFWVDWKMIYWECK